MGFIK